MISAIVLAAGKSTRMGKAKLLLPVGGKSIIRIVVEHALRSKAGEVIVVLGSEASRIRREVELAGSELAAVASPLKIVENPRFEEGQSTSLKAGLSSVDERCEGVLVLMGDQPFVGQDILDALIGQFHASNAPLIIPEYDGVRATPILFGRELFSDLMAVTGDKGGRDVVTKHLKRALVVRVESGLAGRDVDTWEDYLEMCGKGAW